MQSYQQGDKQALNDLIQANTGIIYKLIKRFYFNSNETEDIFQIGVIGLILAAKKYDFNNKNKATFITYAVYWINSKISRYLKYNDTSKERSLDEPLKKDNSLRLKDTITSKIDLEKECIDRVYQEELKQDLKQDLKISIKKVNSLKEMEILYMNYGLDHTIPLTMTQIEEILNLAHNQAQNNKHTALSKLRTKAYGLPIEKYREEKILQNQLQKYANRYKSVENLVYSM